MESYTAQRRLTHEFTNHIAALDALLRQGDLTGAQEYLSSVSKVVAAGTTILDTHNPLLDSCSAASMRKLRSRSGAVLRPV